MLRFALLPVLAAISFAQTREATKPPAKVDQALRARVAEFYQYHVDQQYRKAEKLVAEDSVEIYYVASKPRYLSYQIQQIDYLDRFTRAKVTMICEQYFNFPGFAGKPMKAPATSTWKLVRGKWFWYVNMEELRGPMGGKATAAGKADPNAKPPSAENIPTTPNFVFGKVKWEKDDVVVKPNTTQQVVIANASAATVSLTLAEVLPGIEVTIDKANLNSGEKATVTLKAGENPFIGVISFAVNPTQEIIGIQVRRQ